MKNVRVRNFSHGRQKRPKTKRGARPRYFEYALVEFKMATQVVFWHLDRREHSSYPPRMHARVKGCDD